MHTFLAYFKSNIFIHRDASPKHQSHATIASDNLGLNYVKAMMLLSSLISDKYGFTHKINFKTELLDGKSALEDYFRSSVIRIIIF